MAAKYIVRDITCYTYTVEGVDLKSKKIVKRDFTLYEKLTEKKLFETITDDSFKPTYFEKVETVKEKYGLLPKDFVKYGVKMRDYRAPEK